MTGDVMEEYHSLLDGAVGASPPSTVDIDRIVLAGRRGERARTAALLAGTAALAAGVLAGAAVLVASSRPAPAHVPVAAAAGGQSPTATVTPTRASATSTRGTAPPSSPSGPVYTVDGLPAWPVSPAWPVFPSSVPTFNRVALARLNGTLRGELRKLPGPVAVKSAGGESAFVYTPGVGYTAKVLITHDGLYGWVLVRISWYEEAPCPPRPNGSTVETTPCPPQFGPRGESIYRWIGPVGKVAGFGFNAVVQHSDGTQVSVAAIAADEGGRITDRILPLSMADLVQLGLDPQFSLRD